MAEALLRARLDEAGVAAEVRSAGYLTEGRPVAALAGQALAEMGLDVGGHRSRRVAEDGLRWADLVLAMEREHVRRAVVAEPSVWPRTFTLRELVRRAERIGGRRPDEPLEGWLARAHEERTAAALIDPAPQDDVADPMGGPRDGYARTADELARLVDDLVRLALAPSGGTVDRPR